MGADDTLHAVAAFVDGVDRTLDGDASGSFELDATPGDRSDYSRALPVGGRFESVDAGVRVETLATDAGGATIQVTVGAPAR